MAIMTLAIINGLITSIILETFILWKQMDLSNAFKTAIGMSLISMIAMEAAMNITDELFNARKQGDSDSNEFEEKITSLIDLIDESV